MSFFREILLQNAYFQINFREKVELFLFVSRSMHRLISICVLQLYGLIIMTFTVVLLISCLFFQEILLQNASFQINFREIVELF